MAHRFLFAFLSALLLSFGIFQSAEGQYYFGKNKVQYESFEWQLMKTPRFDIYFYPEEKGIAEIGAAIAERSYTLLERRFGYTVSKRIPLIFYSSPIHFQQTNTTPGLIPEGVAGFMEFIKGRVVIPNNGSFSDFRRVITHELVHVFTFDKIGSVLKDHNIYNMYAPPLWFTEGLAEYWSKGWDSQAEMVIKDALFSESLVPISQMYRINGSFKMYKEGQSIVKFMAEKYGEDKIALLLDNWWKDESFARIFRMTTGDDLSDFGAEWVYHLKKRYFPDIGGNDTISRSAEELTGISSSVKPAVIPSCVDTAEFVFLSNVTGYSDIYRQKALPGAKAKRIVKGGRTADFESFHFLSSKISVSKDGILAFVSKTKGRDSIYLWDLADGEVLGRISFDDIVSISSPAWSPDGNHIAFSGIDRGGRSDLYTVSPDGMVLVRLTNDIYDDRDPDWSPDGRRIAFSSDRCEFGHDGAYNIFTYDLDSGEISYVTWGPHKDLSPSWSPDGSLIAFSSDRDGTFNLYVVDMDGGITRLTDFLTGAFDPDWTPDGGALIFSGFENYSFHIYKVDVDLNGRETENIALDRSRDLWTPPRISESYSRSSVRYRRKYGLDIAQSQVAYDPELGTSGGLQLAITDMLGDYQYYFLLSNTSTTKEDFLKSFNFALTKLDLSRQANLAWGVFHLTGRYYNDYDGFFDERRYGGFFGFNYPFSKFRRVEASIVVRGSEKSWVGSEGRSRYAVLISNYLGYTVDTSLWGPVGPIDGTRYNLTVGHTVDAKRADIHYTTFMLDWRRYLRISRRSSFAVRLIWRSSYGREPQRFYMGGSWTFRGYRWDSIWGRKLFLWNNELRFPLIDDLSIGFPFGRIGFSAIRGALFADVGNAWEGKPKGLLGSIGVGVRMRLSNLLVLRLDFSKRTDFRRLSRRTYSDFFFGWSF